MKAGRKRNEVLALKGESVAAGPFSRNCRTRGKLVRLTPRSWQHEKEDGRDTPASALSNRKAKPLKKQNCPTEHHLNPPLTPIYRAPAPAGEWEKEAHQ